MKTESEFEKSFRINGFGQDEQCFNKCKHNSQCTIHDLKIRRSEIEPVQVDSVSDYLAKLEKHLLDGKDAFNPFFFRGHLQANYLNLPSSMRNPNDIKKENWTSSEYMRRCPEVFEQCTNTFDRLSVMQHYGASSRCLDLTENPLAALAFACIAPTECQTAEQFEKNKNSFATVTVFQAPTTSTEEYLKYYDSSTVSVIANTSLADYEFKYGNLNALYKKDGFGSYMDDFIYFRDIIRRSVIVRAKLDHPRIKSQTGAFVLVNANECVSCSPDIKSSSLAQDFTREIISNGLDKRKPPLNVCRLKDGKFSFPGHSLSNSGAWDFEFRKVLPYSLDNKIEEFRDDPFDLKRFLYRPDGKKQLVFFIPPKNKEIICKQLRLLGFDSSTIYPEPHSVFTEINKMRGQSADRGKNSVLYS